MALNVDRLRSRAVEIGLYLPLGVYSKARDELADLDRKQLAKLFDGFIDRGQGRVQPLEQRLRRGTGRIESEVTSTTRRATATAKKTTRRAKSTAAKSTRGAKSTARKTTRTTARKSTAASAVKAPKMPRVAAPRTARELPIESYGSLTAEEIVARLSGLTQTDLAKVYKFEKAHENRNTILEAADSKMVDLPISTYDALTVDEINNRLDSLDEGELRTLRRYEISTKQRNTILDKIDSLLA